MKELERYLGATYSDRCQTAIMTETPVTLPSPYIPTIIPDMVVVHPKTDAEMNYLEKKNIDLVICKKLSNKCVYKTDMKMIYNLVVGKIN